MSQTPRFWWYPSASLLRYTALQSPITDLQEVERRTEATQDTADGHRVVSQWAGWRDVSIRAELLASVADARELEALVNHIRNRNVIAFAEDTDVNSSGWSSIPPIVNTATIWTQRQPHLAYGSATLNTGDTVVLKGRGTSGVYLREEHLVESWDGTTLTLQTGDEVINEFSGSIFWHDKRFHPYLRLRASEGNSALLSHDRRVTWTLDLPMEELPYDEGVPPPQYGGIGPGEGTPIGSIAIWGGGSYQGLK